MNIKKLVADMGGKEVVYQVGGFYEYRGEGNDLFGRRVKIAAIYADTFNGGLRAIFDLCDGSCTNVCRLESLGPLSPLRALAEEAE